MNIKQSFILAVKSLKQSRLRSFLTMLGIIVGVSSVFIILTLANSLKETVNKTIDPETGGMVRIDSYSDSDYYKVKKVIEDNSDYYLTFEKCSSMTLQVRDSFKENLATVLGVTNDYITHSGDILKYGNSFNYIDETEGNNSCILSTKYAQYFFGDTNPVGKSLYINNIQYRIVGVTESKFQKLSDMTNGYSMPYIFIPYNNAKKNNTQGSSSDMPYVIINDNVDKNSAINKLNEEFKANKLDEKISSYNYRNGAEIESSIDTITMILGVIAGISLLVGGIGIMNIMLVTVTERIREIGIRKSLGATPKEILTQFLIEATTISLVGGIIGVIIGIGITYIAVLVFKLIGLELKVTVSLGSLLLAFTFSTLIGIIFGYLPAKKAAKMDPIDALSYE